MIRLVGRHTIAIRKLPVDFRVEIRERFTKVRVELPNARLVGARSRLCRVIHKIVSEDLLENVEVSTTLNSSCCAERPPWLPVILKRYSSYTSARAVNCHIEVLSPSPIRSATRSECHVAK